jgi:hypothetical protein
MTPPNRLKYQNDSGMVLARALKLDITSGSSTALVVIRIDRSGADQEHRKLRAEWERAVSDRGWQEQIDAAMRFEGMDL